jgi:hypothetical protein
LRCFQSIPHRPDRTVRRHPRVDGISNTVHPWRPARAWRAQLRPSLVPHRHQGASPSWILPARWCDGCPGALQAKGTDRGCWPRAAGRHVADIALTSRRRSAPLTTLANLRSCSSSGSPRRARRRSQERDTAC